MHPEVEGLRPKLKEVLYDCAVEIRATKAALYLFDGEFRFELVSEYGFKGGMRVTADFNDPLVDRCGRGRNAFFVNGVATEARFSEMLYEASTDRLLAVPLYIRGKLVGLIDMRDKPGRQLFEAADLPKAQRIAERMVDLLLDKAVFGHRFITLSKLSGKYEAAAQGETEDSSRISGNPPVRDHPIAPPAVIVPVSVPADAPPTDVVHARLPSLAALVLDARAAAGRIKAVAAPELVGEKELTAARDVLRSILLIPGVVTATFSLFAPGFAPGGGVQETAARSSVSDEARTLLQSKLTAWLSKRGESGSAVRMSVLTPFGTAAPPVGAADLQKVFTAPVTAGALRGLYLTVAFGGNPDRSAHELLAVLHAHLQLVIEQSLQRGAGSSLQLRIAEKLVEPDFAKYPELRRHSDAISVLCESFGRYLGITPAEAEAARIVGLVHDAGMRLLDYDRLYRKRGLTPEELGFLREHPSVGAALVEPLLGAEIARAVLCHHERVDGRGYPNELHGEEIPLLSRIVQICDAWVAMTDPGTYQHPESRENALTMLLRGAGNQFDAGLAPRFVDMMRSQ